MVALAQLEIKEPQAKWAAAVWAQASAVSLKGVDDGFCVKIMLWKQHCLQHYTLDFHCFLPQVLKDF